MWRQPFKIPGCRDARRIDLSPDRGSAGRGEVALRRSSRVRGHFGRWSERNDPEKSRPSLFRLAGPMIGQADQRRQRRPPGPGQSPRPVAGLTEGVVDAVDDGAFVIVPGLLIESHDADATSPRDGLDPHPPPTGQPPQLGPQRLLLVPLRSRRC